MGVETPLFFRLEGESMKELDFTKVKKQVLSVTLGDGEKLLIKTPSKRVTTLLMELSDDFENITDGADTEVMDSIYTVCAEIMSNNRQGKKVTTEYLSDVLDIEDLTVFLNAYVEFVSKVTNVKN